jgi:hypothetical protein
MHRVICRRFMLACCNLVDPKRPRPSGSTCASKASNPAGKPSLFIPPSHPLGGTNTHTPSGPAHRQNHSSRQPKARTPYRLQCRHACIEYAHIHIATCSHQKLTRVSCRLAVSMSAGQAWGRWGSRLCSGLYEAMYSQTACSGNNSKHVLQRICDR